MRTDPLHFRTAALAALFAVAGLGCTDRGVPTSAVAPQFSAVRTTLQFTVGPLALNGINQLFPDDKWHLRDVQLSGPVTGDLTGQATVTLNANLDAILGSGPAWGTMSIVTTGGETWQGNLTGNFVSGLPEIAIQLFSQVVLHGPGQQLLTAECDETSAVSETLACSGEAMLPH